MSVRRAIPDYDGLYFITITCCRWLHLFEEGQAYDSVYKWFDHLKSKGHYVTGYVIMPNHLHALIAFRDTQGESINKIIGNGKRFMAYDVVSKLEHLNKTELLKQLVGFVNDTDRSRSKKHEVFEPSFEWKECRTDHFIKQKLDYIHGNPCRGNWKLSEEVWDYPHGSALYYIKGIQGKYPVFDINLLKDIDLTRPD
jgi:REP element-mobilizing transposase RayT